MSKYTFKTIVAPEAVRAEFTALRDQLNSSDKELMQAFWNLGIDRIEDIKNEVAMLQAQSAQDRASQKEVKAAAKRKTTDSDKPATKRARKPKTEKAPVAKRMSSASSRQANEKVTEVAADDGEGAITVVVGL